MQQILKKIENILSKLTEEDSVALEAAKNLISKLGIKFKNDLIFISSNYGFLSCSITQLESVKLPLSVQISIVEEAIRKNESVIGIIGILINLKMIDIIRKNFSFEILKSFSNILTGNSTLPFNQQYTNLEVMSFQFARLLP